mgnify:FL=1
MKTVDIQTNRVYAEQRPTTQDDNEGGLIDKWDIYLVKDDQSSKVGKLVRYSHGRYAFFINTLRFSIQAHQVTFQ